MHIDVPLFSDVKDINTSTILKQSGDNLWQQKKKE